VTWRHAVAGTARIANERAAEKGRRSAPASNLRDYRDVEGPFRPHRVGRHVRTCRHQSLRDVFPQERATASPRDGVMVLHSIGRSEGTQLQPAPGSRNIYSPAAYIPSRPRVAARIERSGLLVTDIEILRLALRRDAESLARTIPCPPRGGRAHLRSAFRADVGVLPRRVRKCRSGCRT